MHRLIIGCGYLGLRAARVWVTRGDRVTALTRCPQRAEEFRSEGIEPIVGDILEPDSLTPLKQIGDIDTLLYAVGYDRTSQASRREIYVTGLSNALATLSGRIGRLIYISSISVYGQQEGEWVDESSVCEPQAENGRICLEAEQTVQRFSQGTTEQAATIPSSSTPRDPFPLNILRLAGIYGPGRLLRRIDSLRRNDPLEGNLDAWLNLIHVDDAVAAIMTCEERGRAGETYLVSDDQPVRRSEYYALLASLVGAPEPRFAPEGSMEQSAPQQRRGARTGKNKRCSNRKLREELGVALQFPTYATGLPQALAHSPLEETGGA